MLTGHDTETKAPNKHKGKLPAEDAPIRVLPFTAVLRHTCEDCGREEEEFVSRLVNEGRLGSITPRERAAQKSCARPGCNGELSVDVDVEA